MSVSLTAERITGILLDIEGTTTPIEFVYGVLFPFARARAAAYLRAHASSRDVQLALDELEGEHRADVAGADSPPAWQGDSPERRMQSALTYFGWLMDRDRKSRGLKRLQGLIWRDGYSSGDLKGQVFADVPPALERWQRRGIDVRIFSSGSVLAQRLLFGTAEGGDLTAFLRGYFDTAIGPKTDPESYTAIARAFALTPAGILFVSDVAAELDAARAAGMTTVLSVRPGNPAAPAGHSHRVIQSFDEIGE